MLLDFEQALVQAGFDIAAASRAEDALKILNDAVLSIQGVITDIQLGDPPGGWDIARTAREADPQIPVVYVSADGADEWGSKGVPNRLMLSKPFAMAQLVTAIYKLLNDRAANQPAV